MRTAINRLFSQDFIVIFIPLSLILISYFLFGFYFETNDDPTLILLFNGTWSGNPEPSLFFWHLFTGKLLSSLYHAFPSAPWYGLLMYFMLWCSLVNIILAVKSIFNKNTSWQWVLAFTFLFFFVVFENIVLLTYTRVVILLSGSVLLFFLTYHNELQNRNHRIFSYFWSLSLYFLSLITRPEGGILTAVIMTPLFIAFFVITGKPVRNTVYFYTMLFLMIIGIKSYQHQIINPETGDRKNSVQSIIDYGYLKDSKLADPRDAAIRMAVTNWIFWDKTIVTNDYLRRLTSDENRLSDITQRYFMSAKQTIWIFLKNQPVALAVNSLIFLMTLWLLLSAFARTRSIVYILYHVIFWGIVITIMVVFKLPNRVLNPLVVIYTIGNLFLFAEIRKYYPLPIKQFVFNGAVTLLALASLAFVYRMHGQVKLFKTREDHNRRKLVEISQNSDADLVVFSVPACQLFTGLDPLRAIPINQNKIYVFIGGWPTWYDFFEKKVTSISGSAQFENFFDHVVSAKHLMISSQTHNLIISDYLEKVYNKNLIFKRTFTGFEYTEPTYGIKLDSYKAVSAIE